MATTSTFRRMLILGLLAVGLGACQNPQKSEQTGPSSQGLVFNVQDFGAVGDGQTLCTEAIQKAIDKASEAGGTALIPAGTYKSGTLFLKDSMTLRLAPKAVLKGSPNTKDYTIVNKIREPERKVHHLLYAREVSHFSIEGRGTINGNCYAFWQDYDTLPVWIQHKTRDDGTRRYSNMIEIIDCHDFQIKDVRMEDSPEWTLHLWDCQNVRLTGLTIRNNVFGPNADGIDISGVRNVIISDCDIRTCDDAICLKSFNHGDITEYVTVTNCILETSCAALKAGRSYRDIRNVTMSNCIIKNSSRAVALYAKEGGTIENWTISNIMVNTNAPLVLNRPIQIGIWKAEYDRYEENSHPLARTAAGRIRNILLENFIIETQGRIVVTGTKDHPIENVTMRNIQMTYPHIEDPAPIAEGVTSTQFAAVSQEATAAPAAVVAENIEDFHLENLDVNWPGDTIPDDWKHPRKIENGSMRIHRPTYEQVRPTEMHGIWLNNVRASLRNPTLKPSAPSMKKIHQKGTTQIRQLP